MCKLRGDHKPITQKAKIVWRSVAIVHVVMLHQSDGDNDFTDANWAHFLLLWCELCSSESHVIRITSAPTDLNDSNAHDLKNVTALKIHISGNICLKKRKVFSQTYFHVWEAFPSLDGEVMRDLNHPNSLYSCIFYLTSKQLLSSCFVWMDKYP